MTPSEPFRSTSTTVNFQGKSGERYSFQAWPLGTKLKAIGGVYIFTKRTFEDRTFTTKASHHVLGIGHARDLAAALVSDAETRKIAALGGNCICVYAVADEARCALIEKDLMDGNDQWGGRLRYLFHPAVPERAPGGD
jgi:hypothetical protein